jgi:hypothetical protein
MTLLGPRLHDLTAADVQAFLDAADSEPLLWEAKGTKLDPHAVRKEACGFANGRERAYLILGAEQSAEGWRLGGFDFAPDPPAWVSAARRRAAAPASLRRRLDPAPERSPARRRRGLAGGDRSLHLPRHRL